MGWWSEFRDDSLGVVADFAAPIGCVAGLIGTAGNPQGCALGAQIGGAVGKAIDPDKGAPNGSGNSGALNDQFEARTQKAIAGEAAWDDMFGSVEANMAEYYSTLTVGKIAARGNEALENAYTQSSDRLSAELRTRGIDMKSGLSAQLMSQQLSDLATEKSKMYGMAEQQFRAEQAQGYQLGQQISGNVDTSLAAQAKYENQVSVQDQNQQRIDYGMKNPYEQDKAKALFDVGNDIYKKYNTSSYNNSVSGMGNLDPNNYGTRVN